MTFKTGIISYAFVAIWGFLKFLYNLFFGIGTERIDRIRLSYKVVGSELRIYALFIILLRKIPLDSIQEIMPFSGVKKDKVRIFFNSEHFDHTWFKKRVVIKTLENGKTKWIILSPGNIDEFIKMINAKRGA